MGNWKHLTHIKSCIQLQSHFTDGLQLLASPSPRTHTHSQCVEKRKWYQKHLVSIILWHPSVDVSPYRRAVPSARYHFSTFEIVSSESSDAFSCGVESDWQPPGKAINTTICGVITLEAFTFNFSTVCSSAAEALFGDARVCVLPCDLNSTQFTNLFSQMQLTHIQIATRNNSTLIWILSASFACVLAGFVSTGRKHARTCAYA